MTPKSLVPFVLLTLAVVFSLRTTRPRPAVAPAPSAEQAATPSATPVASELPPPQPRPSASADDKPLTDREMRDRTVKVPLQACVEIGQHINQIAGVGDDDKRKLNPQIFCMRQGNIAWARCIDDAKTRHDVATCNRRLLH